MLSLGFHEMHMLQTAQQGTVWTSGHHCPPSGLLIHFSLLLQSAFHPCLQGHNCACSSLPLCLVLMTTVVITTTSPMRVVHTLLSFFLGSGNTPIAVWGTHLDLIQNPQIRAKHGGKEHINVSPFVGPCPLNNDSWHGIPPSPG